MGAIHDIYTNATCLNDTRYFTWLGGKVGLGPANYSKLMEVLGKTEFSWRLPLDENRAFDGLKLRNDYNKPLSKEITELGCSIFEMLVGLSVRVERDITGTPGDEHPEKWFWQMLENLGISDQNDDDFDMNYVSKKLINWMFGSGKDSIFKFNSNDINYKNMQIWDQMTAYLNENYVIDD